MRDGPSLIVQLFDTANGRVSRSRMEEGPRAATASELCDRVHAVHARVTYWCTASATTMASPTTAYSARYRACRRRTLA